MRYSRRNECSGERAIRETILPNVDVRDLSNRAIYRALDSRPRRRFLEIEDFAERDMRPCRALCVYSVYSINLPPDEPSQRGLYDLHARRKGSKSAPRSERELSVTFNAQKIASRPNIIFEKKKRSTDAHAAYT